MEAKQNVKEKKKRKGKGCLVALMIVVVLLLLTGGIGWAYVSREHREARNLPLNAVDFSRLNDGVWHGAYAGGMYQWRHNECDVTVIDGKLTDIALTESIDPGKENAGAEMLYERVIKDQSLQVDTISSATLTGKGYLQCVENALIPAMHN
jgi:uncharacterized protein with FMN-binding domain